MTLFSFIQLPGNGPFLFALIGLLIFAVVEVVSTFIGASISEFVDDILPDIDIDPDIEADIDTPILVLDWLNLGKVPFLVLLVIILFSFSVSGLSIQLISFSLRDALFNSLLASVISLIPTVLFTHYLGRLVHKLIPQTLTTAIDLESLVGKAGEITIGTAKKGMPAEAKVIDQFGKTHYVRVAPMDDNESYPSKTQIVLIEYSNGVFSCEKLEI
ncbi:OB-fold-containig protein [Spirochaeta cellobiosiphila]|uniref:OB-fold-containig protein n=1 Tax=Spirochaeta cellobiosiphila TaxID=504483 RepID=UPI00041993A8|nr:OB-fold-containig protein [Spirochaeta cellobiosiphila]